LSILNKAPLIFDLHNDFGPDKKTEDDQVHVNGHYIKKFFDVF